jgi:endogenous inhibitor of DNA gyrase (YacG/DUF329 family)
MPHFATNLPSPLCPTNCKQIDYVKFLNAELLTPREEEKL